MQSIVILSAGKTFRKWIVSMYLSLCLFPLQEILSFQNFRLEKRANARTALVKEEMYGSEVFTPELLLSFTF